MRIISTKTHGYLDYIVGIVLIAAPWIFTFDNNGPGTWIPVIAGILIVIYSLVTDHEDGASPLISLRIHLLLDFIIGFFTGMSPVAV